MCEPFVSVIIPVYNDTKRLEMSLEALSNQTYDSSRFEVIVCDNNSNDNPSGLRKKFSTVVFCSEKIKSSYAARNRALSLAKGEVLAFTDADCIPDSDWITQAVVALDKLKAHIIGGRVAFIFQNPNSVFEIYDAVTHMNNKINVEEQQRAATANLITRKEVFDQIGLFPLVESGGDFQWTDQAHHAGYKLAFAQNAIVNHPTRRFPSLWAKQIRVGKGWQKKFISKYNRKPILTEYLKAMLPPRPRSLKHCFKEYNAIHPPLDWAFFWPIWFVAILCTNAYILGILASLFLNKDTR